MAKKVAAKKTEPVKAERSLVLVEAQEHLGENGEHYKPGDRFEVSAERASALGALVRKVEG